MSVCFNDPFYRYQGATTSVGTSKQEIILLA